MKLRIKGDSVRLRLGPREVDELVRTGTVAEVTAFAGRSLGYELVTSAGATGVTAAFDGDTIRVTVPTAAARRWAESPGQVELAGDDARPAVSVEKDFVCLDQPGAGGDAFPHPAAAKAC